MRKRCCECAVVLVQSGDEPIVQAWHRDFARVQYIDNMPARFAAVVNLERFAVRFVLHHDPAAAIAERVRQDAELLHAVGFVIHRTDDGEPRVERTQHLGQADLIEEVDEQVGGGRSAVDHEQIGSFRSREHAIDFASMFEIDEFRLWVETLQCRVLVIAVDRAMSDPAIFQILHEVRGEEALPNSAFAVDDKVDLFVHVKVRWFRGCEDRRRAVRVCVDAPLALRCAAAEPVLVRAVTRP